MLMLYLVFMICGIVLFGWITYEGHMCAKYFTIGCGISILWPVIVPIAILSAIVVGFTYLVYNVGKWLENKGGN
jgi:hypothetical protein